MWRNYLKVSIRNLVNNPLYTTVNGLGLAIGLAVAIIIAMFIQSEVSFDRFHRKSDRIYRAIVSEVINGEVNAGPSNPMILAEAVRQELKGVEAATRYIATATQIRVPDEENQGQVTYLVSPEFFEIFDFSLAEGDPGQLFKDKYQVALSKEMATRLFGDIPALGSELEMQVGSDFEVYTVAGILNQAPGASSLHFDILIPDQNRDKIAAEENRNSWFNFYGETYLLLEEGQSKEEVESATTGMIKKSLGEQYQEGEYQIGLQPLTDIHLNEELPPGQARTTRPQLLWILGGIALVIVMLASINYTTLAIGRSAARAREVGVRKTLGARRKQLIGQYLSESLILTLMALVLGFFLLQFSLPVFNQLFDKEVAFSFSWQQLTILLSFVLVIATLSGLYPAIFLSSLQPAIILKSFSEVKFGKLNLRKALVAFQLFLAISLITATLMMYRQMDSLLTYDLGFNRQALLEVEINPQPAQSISQMVKNGFRKAQKYKSGLAGHSAIREAGVTLATFGDRDWWTAGFPLEDESIFYFKANVVDPGYLDAMGLELVAGRNLTVNDSSGIIINESMAKALNWEDPLGSRLPSTRPFADHRIVGVVRDFNHSALYHQVEPVMLFLDPGLLMSGINHLNIATRISPKILVSGAGNDLNALISVASDQWEAVFPGEVFEYEFVDDLVRQTYEEDQRLQKMVGAGAILATVIAVMGLFTLASLSINTRRKEISIRRILGASQWSISYMFNLEFFRITVISLIFSLPLSYFVVRQWLEQFEVKAAMNLGVFGMTIAMAFLLNLIIVSLQAIRTSRSNPVDNLQQD